MEKMEKNDITVEVKNLSFKYNNKINVLENVNMIVPKNCIYALLGPSGSGKTTLLRLMLGRIKLQYGDVNIFGNQKPGYYNRIIGYMPQSQALSPEFTVKETFDYFASLYQLSGTKYIQLSKNLKKIFCLPNDERIVSTLSGGQQKALSLALVFLHSPKLVFLDEPTVGTDPVLGNQIWKFLRQNSANGLSAIIVTHYIQEASLADRIGMMRGGRMIEEGQPQQLYQKYQQTNLETIFIQICTQKPTDNELKNNVENTEKKISTFFSYYKRNNTDNDLKTNNDLVISNHNHRRKSSIIINENQLIVNLNLKSLFWLLFILIRRNMFQFFQSKLISIMIFSPTYCTLLMCIIFKVDKININTAVYNEDITQKYSVEFQNIVKNFTNLYINYQQYHTLDDAINSVYYGKSTAAIWFQPNFSTSLRKRVLAAMNPDNNKNDKNKDNDYNYNYDDDIDIDNLSINNYTIDSSTIKLFINNANAFHSKPIYELFEYGSWELYNKVLNDENQLPLTTPVNIKEIVYGTNIDNADFLLPGYMISFIYLSLVTMTSQLLIMERNDGFFDRAIVAGAKHSLMFFSHFFSNLIFALIQIILMFFIGFYYRMHFNGSIILMFFLILTQSASAIMTGLLISASCKENFSAFFISLSITLSQLFTSGALFPIISFDPIMKFFLSITPIAMPVESLRNVMLRGWTLKQFNVLHGLITNIVLTIIFGSIALFTFKRKS